MAAACYEKEVAIESINSHILGPVNGHHHHFHHHSHHHHHHHRTGNVGTSNNNNNNNNSNNSTSSSSTPVSSSNRSSAAGVTVIGQTILSPTVANDIVIAGASPYKAEPTLSTNFKDYAQPLHVDCSVEYELPSQAKPPPGGGEPLLMIHPCYYRRAERERRSPFVNNLPPIVSSTSGRKTSRRVTSSVNSNHVSKSMSTSGDAASVAVAVVATATAAVCTSGQTNANATILLGDALTASSPSSIAINTLLHRKQTRREDDCHNQDSDIIDKKRLSQQHRAAAFSTVPNAGNLTTADEKAVISGIYQHYFRAMRSHHQPHHHHHLHQEVDQQTHTQVPQQHHHLYEDAHIHVNSALTAGSPATETFLQKNFQIPTEPVSAISRRRTTTNQHHPYRRPCSISRAPTAIPTIPSSPSSSSVYATAMNRHREASLQALRMAAAAVAAAAAAATGGGSNNGTSGSFYEAPAYRALLPRS